MRCTPRSNKLNGTYGTYFVADRCTVLACDGACASPALGEVPPAWAACRVPRPAGGERGRAPLARVPVKAQPAMPDEATVHDEEASATIRLRLVGVTRAEVHVACAPRTVEVRVGGAKPRVFSIDLPGAVEGNTCAFRDGDGAISLRITVAKVQSGSWTENIRVRRRHVKNATSPRTGEVSEPVPRRPADETPASDAEMLRRLADLLGNPVAPPRAASGLFQRLRAAARHVAAAPRSAFDFVIRVVGSAISRLGRVWPRITWRTARRPPALLLALPEDLLEVALARCPLQDHAALARTCSDFRRVVTAPSFVRVRQRLDVAETVVAHVGGRRGSIVNHPRNNIPAVSILPRFAEAQLHTESTGWRGLPDLPARRQSATVGILGSELVVVGGFLEDGRGTTFGISRDLRLDAGPSPWRTLPVTAAPRGGCCGAVVYAPGPLLVVAGGVGRGRQEREGRRVVPHDVVEAFNPTTRQWSRRAPLPVPVCAAAAAADDDRLYVIGGQMEDNFQACGILQIYDARTDTWNLGAPLPVATWGASACVLRDGLLLVAGGWIAAAARTRASKSVWVYHDATDEWAEGPVLPSPMTALVTVRGRTTALPGSTGEPLVLDDDEWAGWMPSPDLGSLGDSEYRIGVGVAAAEL